MASAIVVAAGRGARMENPVRKQYLPLAGRPILSYSLKAVDACGMIDEIILVVPEDDVCYCRKEIIPPLKLEKPIHCTPGGAQRQESVYRGILAVKGAHNKEDAVLIHDGVRPFIRPEQLEACITRARITGASILGVPASDTLKQINSDGVIAGTIDRDSVWRAQTPQAFQYEVIKTAHESARRARFVGTDDAVLVERMGGRVSILEGSVFNIKITTRWDFMVAEALMASGKWQMPWFI